MKLLAACLVALVALATCAREDGQPDPEPQVLVPCHPDASEDDPLACPPVDAGVDSTADAWRDAPIAAP
jgi:hypothetical protein